MVFNGPSTPNWLGCSADGATNLDQTQMVEHCGTYKLEQTTNGSSTRRCQMEGSRWSGIKFINFQHQPFHQYKNIYKTNAQAIPPRRYGLQKHLCKTKFCFEIWRWRHLLSRLEKFILYSLINTCVKY